MNKTRFKPKRAQADYLSKRTGKDFILKARQLGFTTMEQLRKLERALLIKNITVATIAHKKGKTEDIFKMAKFAWDSLPNEFRLAYGVRYDNIKELDFSATGSRYFVDLEARSGTVNDLHISELAFVKDIQSLFAASLEAVPPDGSITLETTANGLNQAHDLWQETISGKNELTAHFYNWTWDEEYFEIPPDSVLWKDDYKELAKKYNLIADIQNLYQLSDGQFYWYYNKARRLKELTKQEYPTIAEEAFLTSSISVFDLYQVSQLVAKNPLRIYKGCEIYYEPEEGHTYVMGVDTAEGVSNDKTSIEIYDITDTENIKEVLSFEDNTMRPDQTAELAIDLGNMYNGAFIIPERNSSGLTTVLKLQDANYSDLFVNTTIDKQSQLQKNEYGWRTTHANRDVMIDDFIELFEENKIEINSRYVINQMKTFVRKNGGRREHDTGYHDDSLFGSFLALQGMKYSRSTTPQMYSGEGLGI